MKKLYRHIVRPSIGQGGKVVDPSVNTVKSILKATCIDELFEVFLTHWSLFDVEEDESEMEDYASAQFFLATIVKLKEFVQGDDHSTKALQLALSGAGTILRPLIGNDLRDSALTIKSKTPGLSDEKTRIRAKKLSTGGVADALSDDPFFGDQLERIASGKYNVSYEANLPFLGNGYYEYLERSIKALNIGFQTAHLWPGEHSPILCLSYIYATDDDEGRISAAIFFIDVLFTIHCSDVRSVFINGGDEVRYCGSLLSSLWICLSESLSKGRATHCKQCGAPLLADRDRGKPLEFCDGNCRKRHERARKKAAKETQANPAHQGVLDRPANASNEQEVKQWQKETEA